MKMLNWDSEGDTLESEALSDHEAALKRRLSSLQMSWPRTSRWQGPLCRGWHGRPDPRDETPVRDQTHPGHLLSELRATSPAQVTQEQRGDAGSRNSSISLPT